MSILPHVQGIFWQALGALDAAASCFYLFLCDRACRISSMYVNVTSPWRSQRQTAGQLKLVCLWGAQRIQMDLIMDLICIHFHPFLSIFHLSSEVFLILCGSPWCLDFTEGVREKRFMSSRRWSFSQMLLPKFQRCQHALATWLHLTPLGILSVSFCFIWFYGLSHADNIRTKCSKGWKINSMQFDIVWLEFARTSWPNCHKFPWPEVLMLDLFFTRTWLGGWQRLVAKSHAQKVPPHLVMFSSMPRKN